MLEVCGLAVTVARLARPPWFYLRPAETFAALSGALGIVVTRPPAADVCVGCDAVGGVSPNALRTSASNLIRVPSVTLIS